MAQWLRQFSGLTHNSKLADAEAALRKAVVALRAAEAAKAAAKMKAVQRLATKVLDLRFKLLKARRNAMGHLFRAQEEIPEQTLLAAGVSGILAEFAAGDVRSRDTEPNDSEFDQQAPNP